MIIVMKKHASPQAVEEVVAFIRSRGLVEHVSKGQERTIIGAVGDERVFKPNELVRLPQVERAIRVLNDWRIISRETQAQNSVIAVRGVKFGGGSVLDVKTDLQFSEQADAMFIDPFSMPDTPYADMSLSNEKEQVARMRDALLHCHESGLPVLVRIRDVRQIAPALANEADILYLGGELMVNRMLQDEVGRLNTPLILCKDKHHFYKEWLVAAERVALKGNSQIILGEAGTLGFASEHIHRLDVDAIARVKSLSHLPVLANIAGLWHNDISQEVLYRLAVAAGADAVVNSL